MKKLIYNSLKTNPDIIELAGGRVFGQGTLGVGNTPADPDKPFLLYTLAGDVPYPGFYDVTRPQSTELQVYCYQDRGSYATINQILVAVRETLLGLPGTASPSGLYRCTGITWGGFSQELHDDTYDANMRYAVANLIGTQW